MSFDELLPGVLPYIIQGILLPIEVLHIDGNEYSHGYADYYRVNEIAAQPIIESVPGKDQQIAYLGGKSCIIADRKDEIRLHCCALEPLDYPADAHHALDCMDEQKRKQDDTHVVLQLFSLSHLLRRKLLV